MCKPKLYGTEFSSRAGVARDIFPPRFLLSKATSNLMQSKRLNNALGRFLVRLTRQWQGQMNHMIRVGKAER
jgi:hypothetical protein